MARRIAWTVACVLLAALTVAARAADAKLVKIETPRGAKQAFILVAREKPKASLIMFAGDHGALELTGPSSMHWGAVNFLVRTRERFAKDGFTVAVVDTPSDHPRGMTATFRMSGDHAGDIGAVTAYLKKKADVPVWLVGTSMGTFSAANGAIAGHADGLVLTSTITHSNPHWWIAASNPDGVAGMALSRITVPTLVVANRDDHCAQSPSAGAAKVEHRLTHAKTVKIVMLKGGWPARSRACGAKAPHGYYGIERQAVAAIANFIKANSR